MLKTTIVICALLSAVPCSGAVAATWSSADAKWVKVQTNGTLTHYVDARSIQVRGKFRYVWQKMVEDVADPERVAVTVSRWQYNCTTRQDTMLFSEDFLKNGTALGGDGVPKAEQVWNEVLSGSPDDAVMKIVCSGKAHH
jgi:predicted polyphosphate/ATP-dependent NAD kinase